MLQARTLSFIGVMAVALSNLFCAESPSDVAPVSTEAPVVKKSLLSAEIQIGTGIENREPTGVSEQFPSDTEFVVGWSRIKGAGSPTEVRHIWKRDGKEVSSVTLNVQSASFRTHSRKRIAAQPGSWTLEIQDSEGNVVGSKDFEVTSQSPQ